MQVEWYLRRREKQPASSCPEDSSGEGNSLHDGLQHSPESVVSRASVAMSDRSAIVGLTEMRGRMANCCFGFQDRGKEV